VSKHIVLIIVIVAVVFYFVGNYFAPNKIEEKVVYKDRTEYIDRDIIKTEVITKDGETKIITEIKERIKEIEKEKEVVKFDTKKWIAGVDLGVDKELDKYIDLNISRKIIGNIYISGGLTSNINLQIVHVGLKYTF
jgi:hypothetical protein